MEILEKDIVVEIDKRVAVSFCKKYKDIINEYNDSGEVGIKQVKRDITNYLYAHRDKFKGKELFSFVYDYDNNIAVTIMKRNPEYEVYDVIGFADMSASEETIEDATEQAETKEQMKILKEIEKNEKLLEKTTEE